jgi:Ribonuclease R winged-helix domain
MAELMSAHEESRQDQAPKLSSGSAARVPPGFDWAPLVAKTVHPLKVAIVEALIWIDRPLSRAELADVLVDAGYDLEAIRYHANGLTELGALKVAHTRQVRGGVEPFYSLNF